MQLNNNGYKWGIIGKPIYLPFRKYQNIAISLIHLSGISKNLSPTPKKMSKNLLFWPKSLINYYFMLDSDCFCIKRVKYITCNKNSTNKVP